MIHPKKHIHPEAFLPSDFVSSSKDTKAKHIVWIIISYVPTKNSGAECMTHCINQYLIEDGWTCTVITPEHPLHTYQGVHIVKFGEKEKIEKALKEASVLVSYLHYQLFVAKLAKQLQKPYVQVNHNSYQVPYIRDILKVVEPSMFYMINNSQWLQEYYKNTLPQVKTAEVKEFMRLYDSHTRVIYPPIDYEKLEFPVRGTKVTLVNCCKEKGGELFLDIARDMPDVEFLAVKGSYNTPVIDTTLSNVTYMENTPNIRDFYEQTKIILMPSHAESWGRVGVEAMALGIPVIAHPTKGLQESLGDAGLFAKHTNKKAWEQLIRKLLNDPWFYTRKSMEGKIRAQEVNKPEQLEQVESWLASI